MATVARRSRAGGCGPVRTRPAHYFISNSFRLVPAARRPGHPAANPGVVTVGRPRLSLSGSNLNPRAKHHRPAPPPHHRRATTRAATALYTPPPPSVTPPRLLPARRVKLRVPGHKPNANRIRHSYIIHATIRLFLRGRRSRYFFSFSRFHCFTSSCLRAYVFGAGISDFFRPVIFDFMHSIYLLIYSTTHTLLRQCII